LLNIQAVRFKPAGRESRYWPELCGGIPTSRTSRSRITASKTSGYSISLVLSPSLSLYLSRSISLFHTNTHSLSVLLSLSARCLSESVPFSFALSTPHTPAIGWKLLSRFLWWRCRALLQSVSLRYALKVSERLGWCSGSRQVISRSPLPSAEGTI